MKYWSFGLELSLGNWEIQESPFMWAFLKGYAYFWALVLQAYSFSLFSTQIDGLVSWLSCDGEVHVSLKWLPFLKTCLNCVRLFQFFPVSWGRFHDSFCWNKLVRESLVSWMLFPAQWPLEGNRVKGEAVHMHLFVSKSNVPSFFKPCT